MCVHVLSTYSSCQIIEGVCSNKNFALICNTFFDSSMHNTIQELRGNVRVFARIRPCLPSDGKLEEEGSVAPFVLYEGDGIVTVKVSRVQ